MTHTFGSVVVEERVHGDTHWVAVRARGAEWSWLTQDDALSLARHLMATYGAAPDRAGLEFASHRG
jgi:hypothetical protein